MKSWAPIIGAVVVLSLAAGVIFYTRSRGVSPTEPLPTPSPTIAVQLAKEKQPEIKLAFSSDGHYATVSISSLAADYLEYNLIYDAVVKGSKLQTGVNATATITGKSTYSQKQLLGSESSGKFTYHEKIQNAVMELTLRDASNRSIFTATYPFTASPGSSVTLIPGE